jgi:hypothetical protein
MASKVRRRRSPALVGRKEAAAILGVKSNNLQRDFPELPEPLQDRGIEGFEVGATPLWPRAEVQELADKRAGR